MVGKLFSRKLRIRLVIYPECRQHQKANGEGLAQLAKAKLKKEVTTEQ